MANITVAEVVLIEVAHFLYPLKSLKTPEQVLHFLRRLGYDVPFADLVNSLSDTIEKIDDVITPILQLVNADTDEEKLQVLSPLSLAVKEAIDAIIELENEIRSAPGLAQGFIDNAPLDQLPKRLLEYLIYQNLYRRYPKIFGILILSGIVTDEKLDKDVLIYQSECKLKTIHWERIPRYLSEPGNVFDEIYLWNSDFNSNLFFSNFEIFLRCMAIPGGVYKQSENVQRALENPTADLLELRIPIFSKGYYPELFTQFGINITPIEADLITQRKKGFALIPYFDGASDFSFELNEKWEVAFDFNVAIDAGLGLLVTPPLSIEIFENIFTNPLDAATLGAGVALQQRKNSNNEVDKFYIFGGEGKTRLAVSDISTRVFASSDSSSQDIGVEFEINTIELFISTGESDSFVIETTPPSGFGATFDVCVGFSMLNGMYFKGSAGIEIHLPVHISLGIIEIEGISILLNPIDDVILIEVSTTIKAILGPLQVTVKNIGFSSNILFPEDNNGRLGPVDFDLGFKPPTGAGGVVDAAGVVVGGGFMSFDDENERYTGILQLNFYEVGLVAIGLITTRLPDGVDGFSMLVNIGIDFDPPIELSFGFTLSGVGGLIGINRSMLTDVLRDGFRNKTLDSILFPEDPIKNANKIISDLRAVFPPTEGQFVVGPMVKFGWGYPNLIVAELGLFLELPDPIRITVLGQVNALFPDKEAPIIEIHVDVLGIFDPAEQYVYILASIYDSRIVIYPLSGDTAFELRWGNESFFAMTLGGFHPRFSPPDTLQNLNRLRVNIFSTGVVDLYCEVYQALTSNSLQFGARLQLHAEFAGAVADGYLSFDALFYFSPFFFDVEMNGKVAVSYEGVDLLAVTLFFNLSGPTPWNARGKASFEVLFFDITVDFDVTWGREEREIPPAVDPLEPLLLALNLREAWGSVLPTSSNMVAVFRSIEEDLGSQVATDDQPPPQPILMHPSGTLEVRENVLPFGLRLEKLGEAPVKTHDEFSIVGASSIVGGEEQALDRIDIKDDFARGQYEKLTKHEKLSLPSFEKMRAGVAISSNDLEFRDKVESYPLEYESIVIEEDRTTTPGKVFGTVAWEAASRQVRANAARHSLLRTSQQRRFEVLGKAPKVAVGEEGYKVVTVDDMTPVDLGAGQAVPDVRSVNDGSMTRMEADQSLEDYLEAHPEQAGKLQVVPAFEAAA